MENNQLDRDSVLIAFHEECDIPTRADIELWAARYPRYAKDIREHAAVRIAMLAGADDSVEEIDDVHLARSRSRLREALYHAQANDEQSAQQIVTFKQLLGAAGITGPELARRLDINRGVIADLLAGRMLNPRARFVDAVASALAITRNVFCAALASATWRPSYGMAKSKGQPQVSPREYDDIIRASGMTPEKISYWLEED